MQISGLWICYRRVYELWISPPVDDRRPSSWRMSRESAECYHCSWGYCSNTLNPLDNMWGLIHNVKIPINIHRNLLRANRSNNFVHHDTQGQQFNPIFHISCNTLWQVWTMRDAPRPISGGCNTNTPRSAYLSPHTWCHVPPWSPHSSVIWGEALVTGNRPIKATGTRYLPCN